MPSANCENVKTISLLPSSVFSAFPFTTLGTSFNKTLFRLKIERIKSRSICAKPTMQGSTSKNHENINANISSEPEGSLHMCLRHSCHHCLSPLTLFHTRSSHISQTFRECVEAKTQRVIFVRCTSCIFHTSSHFAHRKVKAQHSEHNEIFIFCMCISLSDGASINQLRLHKQ